MPASEFEFRHRVWFFSGLFGLGFGLYLIDHTNTAVALLRWATAGSEISPAQMRLAFLSGAVVAGIGVMIRTWGTAYLKADVVHDPRLRSEHIVADGPYRYVRNPLYLGNVLLAAGIGLMASRTGWLVLVAGIFIFHYRLIFREEAELLRTQGDRYRAYSAAVPRMFPALRPRLAAEGSRANWAQAFFAEAPFWAFVAAEAVFALTLNMKAFWAAMLIAWIIYGLMRLQLSQRSGAARLL